MSHVHPVKFNAFGGSVSQPQAPGAAGYAPQSPQNTAGSSIQDRVDLSMHGRHMGMGYWGGYPGDPGAGDGGFRRRA